ncbi:hypothetical protein [Acidimangrovimonas pyrenivorans]|uniref:Flagellar protein FlgN n=1 Tax=Acidimangrovimonas pyrenivorans TaxID=2030798 RepID=A0ABV7AM63_9RHOB
MQSPEPSRFRKRLEARRAGAPAEAMTDEDRQGLAAFESDIVAVTELLQDEIAAIGAGDLDRVGGLYERKAELLKRIELRMPVVELFLRDRLAGDDPLRARFAAFRAAVEEDSALLDRMSQATAEIVREIEKIRDRHSLNGLYGKSGQKLGEEAGAQRQIDKTI